MHKYTLVLTRYTEEGSLTNEKTFITADTAQDLSDKYTKYNKLRYTTTDPEGHEVIGGKMYKCEPMQGVYVAIDDFAAFCTMNGVLV